VADLAFVSTINYDTTATSVVLPSSSFHVSA